MPHPEQADRLHPAILVGALHDGFLLGPTGVRRMAAALILVLLFPVARMETTELKVGCAFLVVSGATMVVYRANGDVLRRILRRWILSRTHRKLRHAAPSAQNTVAGITPGTWVCLAPKRKAARTTRQFMHARQPGLDVISYRFVVAVLWSNSTQLEMGFSDGTTKTWHYQSQVFEKHPRNPISLGGRSDSADVNRIADCMTQVVTHLFTRDKAGYQELVKIDPLWTTEGIERAVNTGLYWGLLAIRGGAFRLAWQIFSSLWNGSETRPLYDGQILQLTPAGRLWHRATKEYQRDELFRRQSMTTRGKGSPNIWVNNLTGSSINVAGGNISGVQSSAISSPVPSDAELLQAIKSILALRDIPWNDPRLGAVRIVLEEAVKTGDPQDSKVKRAVKKLREVCENLALGVAGNAAYSLLTGHFT